MLRVTAGFVAFSWGAGIGQFGGLGEPARGDGDGVGVGGAIRIGRRES
ncbi:MAG: hypothetical protein ACRDG7_15900 [Candidatus Limnocylindria bacterium]